MKAIRDFVKESPFKWFKQTSRCAKYLSILDFSNSEKLMSPLPGLLDFCWFGFGNTYLQPHWWKAAVKGQVVISWAFVYIDKFEQ